MRAVVRRHQADRDLAAVGGRDLIARLLHHVLQEAALHRVVVDDEDALGHRFPGGLEFT
jgi:hypothetical protein